MFRPNDFEWDEGKAGRNVEKHRFSFEQAMLVFEDENRLESDVTRERDRELRFKVVGCSGPKLFTVVFTVRRDVCRIISARRSNTREERDYGNRSL